MSTESTEALIERVLGEHTTWLYRCNCGWRPEDLGAAGIAPNLHRAHVAAAIMRAVLPPQETR